MAQAMDLSDFLIIAPRQFGWATYINLLVADSAAKQGYLGIDVTQKEVQDDTPKQEEWRKKGMDLAAQLAGSMKTPEYADLLKELDSTIKSVQTDAGREAKLREMGTKIPRGIAQTDKDEIMELFSKELKNLTISETSATIPDVATYIDGLPKEKTPGRPEAGPLVLPNLLFLAPSIAKLLNIRIEVYVPASDTEVILYTTIGETNAPITKFLLANENYAQAMFPRNEILAAGVKLKDPMESLMQDVQRLQNEAAKKAAAAGPKPTGLAGKASAKAKQALAAARRRMKLGVAFEGEVTVGHERVRLNEEGFDSTRYTDVVSFTQKYMTGNTVANDIVDTAEIFSRLFSKGSEFVADSPLPPCSPRERTLLYKALNTRMMGLRNEIRQLNRISPGNVDLLARANQHEFIKTLIDRMKAKEPQCATYGKEGAISTEELQKSIDEEVEVNEILRKFAVLVLHLKMPLSGTKYDPLSAPAQKIVNDVLEVPFDGSELEPYGKQWEQSFGRLIPGLLRAVVLDEKSPARIELETYAKEQLNTLRDSMWELLDKDTAMGAANWSIVKVGLSRETDPKVQIVNTLKWIVQLVIKSQSAVSSAEAGCTSAAAVAAQSSALVAEQKAIIDQLETRLKELEDANVAAGKGTVKDKADLAAKDTELAQLRGQITEAKAQYTQVTARAEAAEAALTQARTALSTARAAKEAAAASAAACTSVLTEARTARRTADEEVVRIRSQISGLQEELTRLRSGAPADVQEAAKAKAAAAAAEAQLDQLRTALTAAQQAAATATDAKAAAEAAKQAAEAGKTDAETVAREVQADAERKSAELAARIVRLEDMLTEKDERITQFQAELTEAVTAVGGAKQANATIAAKIAALSRQIRLLTAEKTDLTKQLDEAKGQVAAASTTAQGVTAAAAEKKQLETELGQEKERVKKLTESIQALAKSVAEGDPKVPAGAISDVTPSFEQLVQNITGLKATGNRATMSPSLQLCYLQYFVLYFYKAAFFGSVEQKEKEEIYLLLNILNKKVSAAVAEIQGQYGGEIQAMEAMLEVGFDALEAGEGFIMDVIKGQPPGYYFFKNERWTTANPMIDDQSWSRNSTLYNDAFYTIYKQFDADGESKELRDLVEPLTRIFSESTVSVSFRPRFKLQSATVEKDSFYAGKYPCFIYSPTPSTADVKTDATFFINLMTGEGPRQDSIEGDEQARKMWSDLLKAKKDGKKLPYVNLFLFFIVLAKKYLRAKQDDLRTAGCPIPQAFMEMNVPAGTPDVLPQAAAAAGAGAGAAAGAALAGQAEWVSITSDKLGNPPYYVNTATKETTWVKPAGVPIQDVGRELFYTQTYPQPPGDPPAAAATLPPSVPPPPKEPPPVPGRAAAQATPPPLAAGKAAEVRAPTAAARAPARPGSAGSTASTGTAASRRSSVSSTGQAKPAWRP